MISNLSELLAFDHIISNLKTRERLSLIAHPLSMHQIDPILRSRMVNWMTEVCTQLCTQYEFSSKIFFLSVKIMDKYLQSCNFPMTSNDIHLLGVTCMFISCKFEGVYYMSLKVFVSNIARDKFVPADVTALEKKIVQTLCFDIDLVVCVDFLTLICKMYGIPGHVQETAENLLFVFQLLYNTQLLPSTETMAAVYYACINHKFCVSEEIFLLFGGIDYMSKVLAVYNLMIHSQDMLKKFKNPQIYRKFEMDLNNYQIRVLSSKN